MFVETETLIINLDDVSVVVFDEYDGKYYLCTKAGKKFKLSDDDHTLLFNALRTQGLFVFED